MSATSTTVASLRGVSKAFKHHVLFTDVDYDLEPGRIQALQGPNGSGKSVLLKILCGFVKPDTGHVVIDDAYLDARRTFPQDFGVIIDRPGYVGGLTGYQNLQRLAEIRGAVGRPEIEAAMRRVGLDPVAKQRARNYSLGMKQRLALAQAFMEDQRVLVLDEPFNALDANGVDEVRNLLREFRDEGRTVLFTSHNAEDVDALADIVHRLNGGTLERVR
ncbi:ABC transporter ATP-binding protein [Isoptericola sp. NPDC056134]|uniref:ABC transporter ATP-binding protein n=1 Tax=Isoptericola sp. NPDC056134 TaxID=3345723 RepID=UPI0035F0CA9C